METQNNSVEQKQVEPELREFTFSEAVTINNIADLVHAKNRRAGWWTDLHFGKKIEALTATGFDEATARNILTTLNIKEDKDRNVGELLCLVHSEVSEAMEGHRKNLMDDKLSHRSMFEVELADVFIRIFDIAGAHKLDLGGAILEKLNYNAVRTDHKIENRLAENGKSY